MIFLIFSVFFYFTFFVRFFFLDPALSKNLDAAMQTAIFVSFCFFISDVEQFFLKKMKRR